MLIHIVDNYDSFVHNLARYLREAGVAVRVARNDAATPAEILADAPAGVVISPGPGAPKDAGVSLDLIAAMDALGADAPPLLGVCLGHQCMAAYFGGAVVKADEPMHGAASDVTHDGAGLFVGVSSPMAVGRYHSLIADLADADPRITVSARSARGEAMALRVDGRPWHGVQFHPESLLTVRGRRIIENFVEECRLWRDR